MKVEVAQVDFWFHDLCSCLQDCLGTVLLHNRRDPVLTMGAAWEFFYAREDVRWEEFYYPVPRRGLADSLMPFHPVALTWHESRDARAAWAEMREVIAQGRPAIAAVDNFYLPMRPAHNDVHAAHLVVVCGFDDEAGLVRVLESTPPTYHGPLDLDDFLRARASFNQARPDTRDLFFAGAEIRNRWLEVQVEEVFPALTLEWVRNVVATNLRRWRGPQPTRGWAGLAGLARYLDSVCERSLGPGSRSALDEVYVVGWAMQSATALHADFLAAAGRSLGWNGLVEAGRQVERLANDWTPLRMLGAHGAARGLDVGHRLRRRAERFVADHASVLDLLEWTLSATASEPVGEALP